MPSTHPDANPASRYLELVSEFPLRPIRTDDELVRAISMADSLLARGDLLIDEQDYLDVLTDLVEKCEAREGPFPPSYDADMLRHLIDARDISQAKLSSDAAIAESTISAILSSKRGLTRDRIVMLARYFKVSPAVFISG